MMAEFDKACTSSTKQLWLMYIDMVMIPKRYIHVANAGILDEQLGEIEYIYIVIPSSCWPL